MPFLFVYVCDLLEKLEIPFLREVGFLPGPLRDYLRKHVSHWFMQHCSRLDAFSTNAQAVLSMLKPHHQVDRVYGITQEDLELVIARALSLSRLQYLEIQRWRTDPLGRDLAFFVQQVMKDANLTASNDKNHKVTVEEIDQILLQIASYHTESSHDVRSLASSWPQADHVSLLGELYRSVQPREAKWLTRQILKSFGPLKFSDDLELSASSGHSNLPQCLQVSVKMQLGSSSAVRMNGPLISRGHVSSVTPSSSNLAVATNIIARNGKVAIPSTSTHFPLTPPTSSIPTTPSSTAQAGACDSASTKTRTHAMSNLSTTFPPTRVSPASVRTSSESVRQEILLPPQSFSGSLNRITAPARKPSRSALGEISINTSSNSQVSQLSVNSQTRSRHFIPGTGKCQLSTSTSSCPLKHIIFILSPCLASDPYISNSLLRWHGCAYITSLSAIKHPSIPRRCPETGKRYPKIVLVESNTPKPTSRFLKQIGKLDVRRGGKKEWLRVYDWRLLESLGKADQGNVLSHDPWTRMFIGRI